MNSKSISSLSEFINEVEDLAFFSDTVIFRGQPVQRNLLPSISRKAPTVNSTIKERELLNELRLAGNSLLDVVRHNSDLDLLILAQHFGLQTRLLDWSSNPLVALWFACEDLRDNDSYVYALDADSLKVKDIYNKDPFDIGSTTVLKPKMNNPRIIAQHGWFTVHSYSSIDKKFVSLEKNKKISPFLSEFVIPNNKKRSILHSLDRSGINSRTLYPDMEGLCRYLNWKRR